MVWANLAQAYAGLAGTKPEADRKPLFIEAAKAYGIAVNLKPKDANILTNYAATLGRVGRLDEARAATEKAIALDPTKAGLCYFNLGAVLYNSNQDDAALAAFEKVPKDSPEFEKAKGEIDNIRLANPVFKSISSDIQRMLSNQPSVFILNRLRTGFRT